MLEKVFCPNIAPSPGSGNHPFYKAEHMSPGNSGARYRHLAHQQNLTNWVYLKRALKCSSGKLTSSQKLWPKPN